jgi:hypothetical protein
LLFLLPVSLASYSLATYGVLSLLIRTYTHSTTALAASMDLANPHAHSGLSSVWYLCHVNEHAYITHKSSFNVLFDDFATTFTVTDDSMRLLLDIIAIASPCTSFNGSQLNPPAMLLQPKVHEAGTRRSRNAAEGGRGNLGPRVWGRLPSGPHGTTLQVLLWFLQLVWLAAPTTTALQRTLHDTVPYFFSWCVYRHHQHRYLSISPAHSGAPGPSDSPFRPLTRSCLALFLSHVLVLRSHSRHPS